MSASPRVLLVRDPTRAWSGRVAAALVACLGARGWRVTVTTEERPPAGNWQLIAGWGWGTPQMAAARGVAGERFLTVDGPLIGPGGSGAHLKLSVGSRWLPCTGTEFPPARLARFNIRIQPPRRPGRRVLFCGMSPKAAGDWGEETMRWERDALVTLKSAGAEVLYRPKPGWPSASWLPATTLDPHVNRPLREALAGVDAVATHHSGAAVEALAAGLPVYARTGAGRPLSVASLEELLGAEAAEAGARERLLQELAWQQWTADEIKTGAWLMPPSPFPPLLDRLTR